MLRARDSAVRERSAGFHDNVGSSSVRSPTYTYAGEGSYTVTLTATVNSGVPERALRLSRSHQLHERRPKSAGTAGSLRRAEGPALR